MFTWISNFSWCVQKSNPALSQSGHSKVSLLQCCSSLTKLWDWELSSSAGPPPTRLISWSPGASAWVLKSVLLSVISITRWDLSCNVPSGRMSGSTWKCRRCLEVPDCPVCQDHLAVLVSLEFLGCQVGQFHQSHEDLKPLWWRQKAKQAFLELSHWSRQSDDKGLQTLLK